MVLFNAECECEIRKRKALSNAIKSNLSVIMISRNGKLFLHHDNTESTKTVIPNGTKVTMSAKHVKIP
jgi:hypothetical protein